jgi:ribose/xylose/arabinose/galactoside ABC-type transport system permease subunit
MWELRDLDERLLSALGPNRDRLTEWQKPLRADSKVIVIPLGSGTESGSRTAGLKPDELAVIAVINNLTLVFARENVSRHLYLLGSNPVQTCFAGAASHRRTTRFVALLAFH